MERLMTKFTASDPSAAGSLSVLPSEAPPLEATANSSPVVLPATLLQLEVVQYVVVAETLSNPSTALKFIFSSQVSFIINNVNINNKQGLTR